MSGIGMAACLSLQCWMSVVLILHGVSVDVAGCVGRYAVLHRFAVALDYADLQHLVLIDVDALAALHTVANYLARYRPGCAPSGVIFSGRYSELEGTIMFADAWADSDEALHKLVDRAQKACRWDLIWKHALLLVPSVCVCVCMHACAKDGEGSEFIGLSLAGFVKHCVPLQSKH
jgi:hypothetical protein